MQTKSSLPHSQDPATCPYPTPDQSSPCPPPHSFKIRVNIILPSTPRSSNWFSSHGSPQQNTLILSPIRATCTANLILLHLITRVFSEEYRSLSSLLSGLPHSPVISPLLGQHIILSTLFSNNLSPCSSLNVSGQDSHPYETTCKITVVYILIVDRGGTVVKVLCYKSEGRCFDPSWCHWNFSLT